MGSLITKRWDIQPEGFQLGCDEPTASLRRDQRHGRFWFGSLLWRLCSATKPRQRFGFALRLLCDRGEYFHNEGEGSQGCAGRNSFQIGVLWNRSCRDRRWKCYRPGYSGTSKCEDEADLGKLGLRGQRVGKWSQNVTRLHFWSLEIIWRKYMIWYDELIWLLTNMKSEIIHILNMSWIIQNLGVKWSFLFLTNIMSSQTPKVLIWKLWIKTWISWCILPAAGNHRNMDLGVWLKLWISHETRLTSTKQFRTPTYPPDGGGSDRYGVKVMVFRWPTKNHQQKHWTWQMWKFSSIQGKSFGEFYFQIL